VKSPRSAALLIPQSSNGSHQPLSDIQRSGPRSPFRDYPPPRLSLFLKIHRLLPVIVWDPTHIAAAPSGLDQQFQSLDTRALAFSLGRKTPIIGQLQLRQSCAERVLVAGRALRDRSRKFLFFSVLTAGLFFNVPLLCRAPRSRSRKKVTPFVSPPIFSSTTLRRKLKHPPPAFHLLHYIACSR